MYEFPCVRLGPSCNSSMNYLSVLQLLAPISISCMGVFTGFVLRLRYRISTGPP